MRVFRWLARITMIVGPLLVLLVFVLTAFLMWVLVTAPGTRWALTTAVEMLDGRIEAVEGSVWNGMTVGDVSLSFPGVALRLEDLELKADWRRLLDRQLHVHALRVDTAWVDLTSTTDAPEEEGGGDEPFSLPELPVSIRVDEIGLGELRLTQDGEPLPVDVRNFASALSVGAEQAQLWLRGVSVATDSLEADLQGEVNLQAMHHPWPAAVDLDVTVNGLRPGAAVCFHDMLPTLPVEQASQGGAAWLAGVAAASCPLNLRAQARGSLEAVSLELTGNGQGMVLEASAELAPLQGMPLREADIVLMLPDGSSLTGHAGWEEQKEGAAAEGAPGSGQAAGGGEPVLAGELKADRLDAGQLAGGAIPPAVLGFDSRFRLRIDEAYAVRGVDFSLEFHEGTQWNDQPLSGRMALGAVFPPPPGGADAAVPATPADESTAPGMRQPADGEAPLGGGATDAAAGLLPPALLGLALHRLDLDLALGDNRIHSEGGIGASDSRLDLDVQAPRLADFWPGLPGGVALRGGVAGGVARHAVDIEGRYVPDNASRDELGTAPVALALKAEGGWGGAPEGWRGRIAALKADHAHLGVALGAPLELSFLPGAVAPDWQWSAGPTEIGLSVNGRRMVSVRHAGSRGGPGRWETGGLIERFIVSPQILQQIGADFDIAALRREERGGVKVRGARSADDWELAFGLDWKLSFDGVPQGNVRLRRLSGDLMVPGDTPFPLGLQALQLDLALARANASSSRLDAALTVETQRMGRVAATASTLVHVTPAGGVALNPADIKTVTVDAAMADLGWTSLILGDALDIGGAVQANVKLNSRPDGSWSSAGTIQGTGLRVVMIDQGVRLLDGTLRARLEDERLVLERLEFPARLRAEPKEWRTAEWVNTNPDAKGGSLVVAGDWHLIESRGVIDVALHRFPILQRADRYAMMTGDLRLDAALPDLAITGKLTADAGWFDLDMLGGIPTVDSDVVVVRAGEEQEVSVPLGITLDLEVDLGPRFYLTGYGLNSGLVGNMRVMMAEGKLTGLGALRTRGGAIEAYGQRLQLRRGAITFQGDITRPVLDIEALRTGLAVEAGVRVAGTARSPRIELVSYPAVSEIEKLSWLLLGHGPNDTGGDMALLFSVGTSFLSDGEPFYRRFGIDEVSLRSGELASVASVLPVESVVSGLDSGTSDIERRFVNVSKRLTSGVTLSIRQALSETGTVARASYRLARGLTAEASVGTINGLALVYRWFSRDREPQSQE
ncbi:translocation/assembly module TamB domain-containing protein [Alcaligenaceae bacterium]|nr:translocation/assembly module TamB domain-containing protein [Alcaligenaceae bacterium]